jgi:hypothetical protein
VLGRTSILIIIALLATSFALVATSSAGHAAEPAPAKVTVGIWLVSVQQVDLVGGTYNVDFYLWFNSTGNPQHVKYEFMNGQATSTTVNSNTSTYQEYRVRGTFSQNLDFKNFPFDNHSLTIQLESSNAPSSQLTFVPDTAGSGIDPSLGITGWNILGSSMQTLTHAYPGGSSYSRAVFSFTVERPVLQSFMKNVLPVVLITAIAMLAFFLPPARSFERVFIGVATLLAAVQLQLSVLTLIPPVGYLTLADKMMLTVYALILYGLGVTIYLAAQVDKKDLERASRLNKKGAILVPVIAVIILGVFLLLG